MRGLKVEQTEKEVLEMEAVGHIRGVEEVGGRCEGLPRMPLLN